MKSRLFLLWSLLVGLFLLTSNAEAARATTLILGKSKPEPKIDIIPTAEDENESVSEPAISNLSNDTINVGNATKLTGVPQIDYIYDPNLPRELNGYNLTDYPFYNSVPEDIDFKCDGLHDGFYASVPHKCQVYHHCLFGTRYDFLCANYTAFDQKTFICHFASEVDCKNSPKYFNRNEALYKATTTTTSSPFGSSGLTGKRPQQESQGGRRRRPYRRRKPSYEYYDEYEAVAEDDYYDEGSSTRRRKRPRPFSGRDSYDDEEEEGGDGEKSLPPSAPNKSVYDRPRLPPKIRRPVPVNEREKYDYSSDSRVIVKEPSVDKKRFEETESGNRKQGNNRAPDYYELPVNGHPRNKEPDTERDREREHKGDAFDRDRENDRDRESDRDRERERERDDRPFRDRRPTKKRRRPDGLDDEYDEYDDVRRHRTSNRNRHRYEEYDEYEYDERPYRISSRSREQDYRPRDHDYEREKPSRNRDSDYDRPIRNRDRVRDDDRPIRNRDVDERVVRNRDLDKPLRSRDDDRPVRNRDSDRSNQRDYNDQINKNRNEKPFRTDEDRAVGEIIRNKDIYWDGSSGGTKGKEGTERTSKYKGEEDYTKNTSQEETDKYIRLHDRDRNQERPPRYRDDADKLGKGRPISHDDIKLTIEQERIPDGKSYNDERHRAGDSTERLTTDSDRGTLKQRHRPSQYSLATEDISFDGQSNPVPASRPAYITKPTEAPTRRPFSDDSIRRQNNFKRPLAVRVSSTQEDSSEQLQKSKSDPRPPETVERPFERARLESEKRPELQMAKYYPAEDIKDSIEHLNEKLQPIIPSQQAPAEFVLPNLKVPHEDLVPKEELAPKAPTFSQTSSRRRPFLPSRNGNGNLPRGLLPVGAKALQTPRGFQIPNKKENEQQPKTENYESSPGRGKQDSRYSFANNGGVEFRAKLSAAIGVDQPKLTQFFQDVQSSSEVDLPDYEVNPQKTGPSAIDVNYYSSVPQKQTQERTIQKDSIPVPFSDSPFQPTIVDQFNSPNTQDLSSSHLTSDYRASHVSGEQPNSNINFRTPTKPADLPQLGGVNGTPQIQENKNLEQTFRNRQLPSVINHQLNPKNSLLFAPAPISSKPVIPPSQLQQQSQPQLRPQSFLSENPKFRTTLKDPEPFPYKPAAPALNFNQDTHLPVFPGGLRQNLPNVKLEPLRYENPEQEIELPQENQLLNLKFPSQREKLEDTDEFDVSVNDALGSISTLHPRNVPSGVYMSNLQMHHQQSGVFSRRIYQVQPPTQQHGVSREYNRQRQELHQRAGTKSTEDQNQQKTHKFGAEKLTSSGTSRRYFYPLLTTP